MSSRPMPAAQRPRRLARVLHLAVHIGAWIPLVVLVYAFLTGTLTVNPIQAAEQRTGVIALALLVLSLACTPLNLLLRQPQIIGVRRALGLYGYMYAAIHLALFTGVDYGFDFGQIIQTIAEKRYIIVGLTAFTILSLLALTSFRWWKAKLGKNWKRLHRMVYLINLLVVLHFGWSVKGDFLRLTGDIQRPLVAGVVIVVLLLFRIPAVRRSIAGQHAREKGMGERDIPPFTPSLPHDPPST